jgi:hypothetical protein
MPDLGPLVGALGQLVMPLLGKALGSFVRTIAVSVAATPLLAALCAVVAANGSWVRGVLGALVGIVAGGIAGVMLAGKRAIFSALMEGLGRLGLGNRAVGLVFDGLLKVNEEEVHGDRGVQPARLAERVPLADAENRLSMVVQRLCNASDEGRGIRAWLRRKIQQRLLGLVEQVTLSRFREQGAQAGGVDLIKVRDELSALADRKVSELAQGAIGRTTRMVLGLTVLGSVAVALLIRASERLLTAP